MKKFVATFYLLIIAYCCGFAQQPFFQNYALLKKNESVQINTIFQDRSGFIWFGTSKGLFKYDGIRFQRFFVADSLPGVVTAIAEDSLGRIWAGQKSGAIGFLDHDKWKTWETEEGAISQPISKILFDRKGVMWFSTLSDGLWYYRNSRLFRVDETNGMPDLFVYDIAEDDKGNVWAGTDGGVAICTLRDTCSIKVVDYKHGLPDNIIKKIKPGKDGKMWMVTDNAGVIGYDPRTNTFERLAKNDAGFGAVADFLLTENQVWLASAKDGLVVHDLLNGRNKIYRDPSDLGSLSINALLKDHEGNIWTGSKTGVRRTLGDYIEYIDTHTSSGGANVMAVAVAKNGDVWWAGQQGLYKRTTTASGFTSNEKQLANTPFDKYTITSLYIDASQHVWVGFYGEGVLRIETVTGKITHLQKELRNGNVLSISGDGTMIWLATLEGAAALTVNGDAISVKSYGSKEGLSSDYIYQVFTDSKKRVWFATDGKGADMMDASGVHNYQKGLNSKIIYGFAEDVNHVIWANVANDGLYHVDGDHFKVFDGRSQLRDNLITCLSSDKSGNIVVMHDLGLDLFEVKRNKMRYLGDEVGIREKLPNLNATAIDDAGRIYFGTSDGIVVYSDLGTQMLPQPLPRIESVKVLDKSVPVATSLNLGHNKNYVTINYLGLWYQNPDNLFYQTKLENYDRDWISSRDHSVTYSSLPPGTYIFRLRISDTADFSSAKEISMNVTIEPPFWQRLWFIILMAFGVVVLGALFVTYRERSLKEDKRILEQRVSERTLEIQRKTEEIQAQNEEIHSQAEEIKGINENLELLVKERTLELVKKNKALEEYAFITAHNLRAPVASVLGLINLASKIEVNEDSKVIIDHLKTSAEKLDNIVRSITEAIEKGE